MMVNKHMVGASSLGKKVIVNLNGAPSILLIVMVIYTQLMELDLSV